MNNKLPEGTLCLISACGIEETLKRLPKNSQDYYLLYTVFEENKKSVISKRNCPKCKENFQPGGPQSVCEAHFHDYGDCGRENCLLCLFACSIGFDEVDRIYAEGTEEEKKYVRGIMRSLDILQKSPSHISMKEFIAEKELITEITNGGDIVISTGVYGNKIYLIYKDKGDDGIFTVIFDTSDGMRRQIYRKRFEFINNGQVVGD